MMMGYGSWVSKPDSEVEKRQSLRHPFILFIGLNALMMTAAG